MEVIVVKTERIHLRVEPKHKTLLASLAEQRQTSMSEVLRLGLRMLVENQQQQHGQQQNEGK